MWQYSIHAKSIWQTWSSIWGLRSLISLYNLQEMKDVYETNIQKIILKICYQCHPYRPLQLKLTTICSIRECSHKRVLSSSKLINLLHNSSKSMIMSLASKKKQNVHVNINEWNPIAISNLHRSNVICGYTSNWSWTAILSSIKSQSTFTRFNSDLK